MSWEYTKKQFGVCGNFRWEIIALTDIKATRSIIRPGFTRIFQAYSTNTSDNKDVLNAQTVLWTGTVDTNSPNELDDSAATFDNGLYDSFAFNTATGSPARIQINLTDATRYLCYKPSRSAVSDPFPGGTEAYSLSTERALQITAATAGDEGNVLIIGG